MWAPSVVFWASCLTSSRPMPLLVPVTKMLPASISNLLAYQLSKLRSCLTAVLWQWLDMCESSVAVMPVLCASCPYYIVGVYFTKKAGVRISLHCVSPVALPIWTTFTLLFIIFVSTSLHQHSESLLDLRNDIVCFQNLFQICLSVKICSNQKLS